jgi:catechol 2,3-dioxygenase
MTGPGGQDRPYGVAPPGFRLPDDTHIGAVRLLVSDLERSLDYYQQVLGMRVQDRSGTTAVLGPHDDERSLVRIETRPGVRHARRGALGLFHFALLLPERAALGRFAGHLSRIGARVGMADHLVSEALYLADPDGLGIEVYADRPRSEWRQRGRELAMATDPLDVRDLVAAGGGREWNGMSPGSLMGHVHLHVGDLAMAEAFFHAALGLDKIVWSYPGALFFSAGGYHHHLATNVWADEPAPADDEARLLEWELIIPSGADAAAQSLRAAGVDVGEAAGEWTAVDPWGTPVRLSDAKVRV